MKKRSIFKRVLSVFLAVLMLTGSVPGSFMFSEAAEAEEAVTAGETFDVGSVEELNSAITAANAAGSNVVTTIKLSNTIAVNESADSFTEIDSGNVLFDFNGNSLGISYCLSGEYEESQTQVQLPALNQAQMHNDKDVFSNGMFIIREGASMQIINSSGDKASVLSVYTDLEDNSKKGDVEHQTSSSLIYNEGTLIIGDKDKASNNNFELYAHSSCRNVNGDNNLLYGKKSASVNCYAVTVNSDSAIFKMYGGNISATGVTRARRAAYADISCYALNVNNCYSAEVYGGEINIPECPVDNDNGISQVTTTASAESSAAVSAIRSATSYLYIFDSNVFVQTQAGADTSNSNSLYTSCIYSVSDESAPHIYGGTFSYLVYRASGNSSAENNSYVVRGAYKCAENGNLNPDTISGYDYGFSSAAAGEYKEEAFSIHTVFIGDDKTAENGIDMFSYDTFRDYLADYSEKTDAYYGNSFISKNPDVSNFAEIAGYKREGFSHQSWKGKQSPGEEYTEDYLSRIELNESFSGSLFLAPVWVDKSLFPDCSAGNHSFASENEIWKYLTDNYCTEDGLKEAVCEKCGIRVLEKFVATGHSFDEESSTVVEPTCTESGLVSKKCTACEFLEETQTPATGHTDSNSDIFCDVCGIYTDELLDSGTSEDITWEFFSNGTLVLSGNGRMKDSSLLWLFVPWKDYFADIKKVIIGDGVENICRYAFNRCDNLKEVIIGSGLSEEMSSHVFPQSAEAVFEKITVSDTNDNFVSVDGVLYTKDMSELICYPCAKEGSSFTVPSSVSTLHAFAFNYADELTEITIEENSSLTEIESSVFAECNMLEEIYLPASVSLIGSSFPGSCDSLKAINVSEDNLYYASIDGVLFNKDKTTLIKYPANKSDSSYAVPDSVTKIETSAFYECKNLTDVVVPSSVTSIGSNAFKLCDNLQSISLPFAGSTPESTGATAVFGYIFGYSTSSEATAEGKTQQYSTEDSSGSITYYHYNIPEKLTKVTITGAYPIASGAFYNCTGLKNVIIDKNVPSVGNGTFRNCSALESITIPFVGASASATAHEAVFGYIFGYMTSENYSEEGLTQQFYADSLYYHYYIPEALVDVSIDGVSSIPEKAFYGCNRIKSVTLSESVTDIANSAFYCSSLEKVNFTGTVSQWCNINFADAIANPLFYGNNFYINDVLVTELDIPDDITEIKNYAFTSADCIEKLNFSDSVTTVGKNAFANCKGLTELEISDGITSLGSNAFNGCHSITEITIGKGLSSIGDCALQRTGGELSSITVDEDNKSFSSLYGVLFNKDKTELILYPCAKAGTSYTVPDSVRKLGESSFCNNENLLSIKLPDGLLEICDETFDYSRMLKNIEIPGSVDSIGEFAFESCHELTAIVLPDSMSYIGDCAFRYCDKLQEVVLPEGIEEIGQSMFSGCVSLSSVTIPSTVSYFDRDCFKNCEKLSDVYFNGTVQDWCNIEFHVFFIISPSAKHPFYYADNFYIGGEKVIDLIIPEGVTSINKYVFRYYEALESVHIPKSVTKIGASAFYGCSNLSSVVIENGSGLNVINSSAFSGCSSLKEADFKDCIELTTLGASVFSGCTALERVNLHSSVETIGNNVFSNHSENLVIGCYENSAVHTYAVENSIPVEFMEHTYISEHFDATTSQEGYTVYTCTHCGDSYTVPDPAGPVENLYVIGETYKISLSWSKAAEASVTGYHVFRKGPDDADYVLVKTINDRNTVSYVDTDVVAESEYFYKVRALKGDIEGEFCEPVSAIALTDTEAPRIIKLEPAASLNSVINKTVSFALKAEDNIGVVKYELYISPAGNEEWLLIGEKNGSSASISFDTTTCVDGEYSFRAVAFDNAGNSGDGDIIKVFRIDNTGPEKVTGLKAIEVYASKATLAWNSVADSDANHFILRRKSGDGYVIVSSSINGSLGYYLNNLLPATEYTYSVACVDHYGNVGEYSDDFTLKTADDTTAPVITALAPSAGRYNNSINFRITASDDCAIQSITVQISSDGKDWKDINTVTYSDYSATKSYSYTVSLSNFTDGAVYIRGITTDKSGNISDTSEKAPLIQYYVDKTAPAAPSGVTAAGGDGYIQIRWNKSDETDISGYYVYRSTSENGTYSKITGKLSTLNHYDRNVERGKTYYYKVVAADTTGNLSVASSYVLSMSLDDTIAPSIGSISPSSMTAISKNNNKIGVLASDNNMLSSITVEYKTAGGDYKILSVFDNIGEYHKVVYTNLPMAEFSDGDTVTVRAFCRDVAGFESAYSSETTYIIDMSAPGLSQLSAVHENGICTLTWNDLSETDLSGYKVYRSVNGGSYSYLGSRSSASSHRYTFKDSVGVGEYVYRIDCVDKAGNLKSYYSQKIILEKPAQITPVIDSVSYMEIGVQEIFSAASSKADNTIVSYNWDFGDGTTSDKTRVTKVYSQDGEYTVSLRITDSEGNTAVVSKNITVAKRELLGTAKVRVVNENGKAISGAPVYFDLGEENQQIVYTNSSGYASLTMKTGVHIVGTYKNGYLPVSNKLTVLANSTAEITLTMVEQNIITGEFEVHEMTFEEIVASGIDIKDPANQQIYEVSVTLIYGEEKIPVRYVRNDTEIISYTIGNSGGNSSGGSSGGNYSPIRNVSYVPNKMNQEIIAVVEVPVTASYLKQFYSANLHIVNNAAAGFEIVNCEASISAPDGLTVVQHTPISSVIDGQSSSTASWILRGDKAGTYSLSASFDGMLADFNVPVTGTFTADEPVVVYGPETVKLVMEVNDEIQYDTLYFNVGLVNQRPVNVNCPNINTVDFVKNVTESVKNNEKVTDGEQYECELERIRIDHGDGTCTYYEPDSTSEELAEYMNTLPPGAGLFYEYVVYDLIDYESIAFFNDASVECAGDYFGAIEVVSMNLHKFDEPNYDAMFSGLEDSEFAVMVVDSSNKPVVNAKVTYDGFDARSNEKGVAIFEKSKNSEINVIISKKGYRTLVENIEAENYKEKSYEVFTLYSKDESVYSLKNCYYLPIGKSENITSINILTSTKRVSSTKNFNFNLKCEAIETTTVEKYELWCSGEILAESKNGLFEDLSVENLRVGRGYGINVIPNNGEDPVMTSINLEIVEDKAVKNTHLEFNHTKQAFFVNSDVPFIGGTQVEFDLLSDSYPLDIYVGEDKVHIGLNLNLIDDPSKTDAQKIEEMRKDFYYLKNYAGRDVNEFAKKVIPNNISVPGTPEVEAYLAGYGEGLITNGQFTAVNLEVMLVIKVSYEHKWYYVVPVSAILVPVVVKLEGEIEGELKGNFKFDLVGNDHEYGIETKITPKIEAKGAVGIDIVCNAGAYGSCEVPIGISLFDQSNSGIDYVDLTGELGLVVEILGAEGKVPFAYNTWHIYTATPESESLTPCLVNGNNMASLFDISTYKDEDLAYAADDSRNISEFEIHDVNDTENNNFTALADNVYAVATPSVAATEDTMVMAYADINSSNDQTANTEIMYSVYDAVADKWNEPVFVDCDAFSKYSPELIKLDNKLYLTYQKRTKQDDLADLGVESYFGNIELVIAQFNEVTKQFEVMGSVEYSDSYIKSPKLCNDGGNLAILFIANSATDPFGTTGGKLVKSVYEDGKWSPCEVILDSERQISFFAVNSDSDSIEFVYAIENDGDLQSNECILYYSASDNKQTKLYEGTLFGVNYDHIPGTDENGFIWTTGSDMLYMTETTESKSLFDNNAPGISDDYVVVGDDILFVSPSDNNTDVYMAKFTDSGFLNPVKITDEEEYIEDLCAVGFDDKIHLISVLTDVKILETNIQKYCTLAWSTFEESSDISIESVYYDFENVLPSEDLPIEVTLYNQGTQTIDEVGFVISADGETVSTQSINVGLLCGESDTVELKIPLSENITLKNYKVECIVKDDIFAENNYCEFEVGYSDIKLKSEIIQKKGKSALVIHAVNESAVAAGGTINVYIGEESKLIDTFTLDKLEKGQTALFMTDIDVDYFDGNNAGIVTAVLETDVKDCYENDNTVMEYIDYAVYGQVSKVELSESELLLNVGDAHKLTGKITPDEFTVNKTLRWGSNDESVAVVDKYGNVTAIGIGKTEITATAVDGSITDTCEITVICNEHKYGEWMVTEEALCMTQGKRLRTCIGCGTKEEEVIPALGHSGGISDCVSASVCDVCGAFYGETDSENHKDIATDKAVAATCTSTGLTEGSHCDACGKVIVAQAVTEKLAHTEKIINKADASCTEAGYTGDVVCEVCGETITVGEVIEASGHDYVAIVTVPTCTKGGYTTNTCSVCKDSYIKDETEKLGHSYDTAVTAPTCTAGGYTTYTCSVCNDTYKADEKAKLGHSMGSFVIEEYPDCTESGIEYAECSRCDYSETREIPATGHSFENGTCTECGETQSINCSHLCHKTGFLEFIWKVINFFNKLFKINQICSCGGYHW